MEIWKDVKDYEGLYQVSNKGQIKRTKHTRSNGRGYYTVNERILSTHLNNKGYKIITLCKNNKVKTHILHRLIAEAFIPNPDNLPQINHKDENKTNNDIKNLEWCTHKYNNNYGTKNNRTALKRGKPVICEETGVIYTSLHDAERKTGVDYRNIHACCSGRYKTSGGYHWKYIYI